MFLKQVFILGAVCALALAGCVATGDGAAGQSGKARGSAEEEAEPGAVPFIPPLPGASGS